MPGLHFRTTERFEDSGAVCVSLIGELDLDVAGEFGTRLRQLGEDALNVRLDLTELEFIDSTGLRELVRALEAARRDAWRLTIGTVTTRAVARVIDLAGLRPYFWPNDGSGANRSNV